MTKTKNTAIGTVYSTLSRRKRPITASSVTEKTGLNAGTVKSSLQTLVAQGKVNVVGQQYTGHRPANLYLAVQ